MNVESILTKRLNGVGDQLKKLPHQRMSEEERTQEAFRLIDDCKTLGRGIEIERERRSAEAFCRWLRVGESNLGPEDRRLMRERRDMTMSGAASGAGNSQERPRVGEASGG